MQRFQYIYRHPREAQFAKVTTPKFIIITTATIKTHHLKPRRIAKIDRVPQLNYALPPQAHAHAGERRCAQRKETSRTHLRKNMLPRYWAGSPNPPCLRRDTAASTWSLTPNQPSTWGGWVGGRSICVERTVSGGGGDEMGSRLFVFSREREKKFWG
jgi:hypothetical protein